MILRKKCEGPFILLPTWCLIKDLTISQIVILGYCTKNFKQVKYFNKSYGFSKFGIAFQRINYFSCPVEVPLHSGPEPLDRRHKNFWVICSFSTMKYSILSFNSQLWKIKAQSWFFGHLFLMHRFRTSDIVSREVLGA